MITRFEPEYWKHSREVNVPPPPPKETFRHLGKANHFGVACEQQNASQKAVIFDDSQSRHDLIVWKEEDKANKETEKCSVQKMPKYF